MTKALISCDSCKRNNSIDIFRLICACMVVMIHIHPFEDLNENVSYFFTLVMQTIQI